MNRFTFLTGCWWLNLGLALSLTGCSMATVMLRLQQPRPSQVELKDVKKIAILDFTTPLGESGSGTDFADVARRLFQQDGQYKINDPDSIRAFIREARLRPSQFQDLSTLQFVADHIHTDAFCFGDLTEMSLKNNKTYSYRQRKIGEKSVEHQMVDSRGNTRVVVTYEPIITRIKVTSVSRQVSMRVKARLVDARNGALLWEREQQVSRTYQGQWDEEKGAQGYWMNDQEASKMALTTLAQTLFQPLLKDTVVCNRQLAMPASRDAYAQLVRKGNEAAAKGNLTAAGQQWLSAFNLDRTRPEAVANLAILREKNGEYAQAIRDYEYAGRQLGQPWAGYGPDIMNYRRNRIK